MENDQEKKSGGERTIPKTSETPKTIAPVEISYKVDEQEININSEDINQLFADIKKYNDQFSPGAMITRSIFSIFEPRTKLGGDKTQETPEEHLDEETKDQQVVAFFVISKHKKLLEKLGLSLKPVAEGATIFVVGDDREAKQVQMMIDVVNKDHFLAFLNELTPEQVESAGLKQNLEKIISTLSQQIVGHYDLVAPEQEAMELFAGMEKIIAAYKRLKINGPALDELEKYLQHGKNGSLREYVAIKQKGLLSPPGESFGPADWQKDSTPAKLEQSWNEAISVLKNTKENPQAIRLYEELSEHLKMCVEMAIKSLESLKYWDAATIDKLRTILETAQQKINELAM